MQLQLSPQLQLHRKLMQIAKYHQFLMTLNELFLSTLALTWLLYWLVLGFAMFHDIQVATSTAPTQVRSASLPKQGENLFLTQRRK